MFQGSRTSTLTRLDDRAQVIQRKSEPVSAHPEEYLYVACEREPRYPPALMQKLKSAASQSGHHVWSATGDVVWDLDLGSRPLVVRPTYLG